MGDEGCLNRVEVVASREREGARLGGFLRERLDAIEKIVAEFYPTDVDREIDIVVTQKILLKALPERG